MFFRNPNLSACDLETVTECCGIGSTAWEQKLKVYLANLQLGACKGWPNPFAGTVGRERAALHQMTPREQLFGIQLMAAGDKQGGLAG